MWLAGVVIIVCLNIFIESIFSKCYAGQPAARFLESGDDECWVQGYKGGYHKLFTICPTLRPSLNSTLKPENYPTLPKSAFAAILHEDDYFNL